MMKFLKRRIILILCFLAIVVALGLSLLNDPPTAQAYDSCALDPSNLILNGSMAGGPPGQYGVIAQNWTAFVNSQNVPNFENALNEQWDPNGSQYIWSDNGPFDAGIYQQVGNLMPGQTYHYWFVWGQSIVDYGGGNNVRTDQIDRQLGVDTTGGTNFNSPTVEWSVPYLDTSGFNRLEWNLYFKATGPTATMFLRVINYLKSGRAKVFFDTVCLNPASDSPTTTPWATLAAPLAAPSISPTPIPPTAVPRTRTPRPSIVALAPLPSATFPPTVAPTNSPVPVLSPTASATVEPTNTPRTRRAIPMPSAGTTASGGDALPMALVLGSFGAIGTSLTAILLLAGLLASRLFFRSPASPQQKAYSIPTPPRGTRG